MDREYLSRFPDGTLVRWRPLTWRQYKRLESEYGSPVDFVESWLLCESAALLCILEQEQNGKTVSFDDLYAGTVFCIGRQIIEKTGFIASPEHVQSSLEQARAQVTGDWFSSAKAAVCALFHITEDVVETWPLDKFMRHCAMVEFVTKQPMTIVTEEVQEDGTPTKFQIGPDGQRIPLVTKADLRRRRPVKVDYTDNPDLQ